MGLMTSTKYCVNIFFYCWTNSTINFYSVNFYTIIKVAIIKVLLKCIFHSIDFIQPPVPSNSWIYPTSWESFVKMDETWNHQIWRVGISLRAFHEIQFQDHFMKYFYFSIQHSLRMFLTNKKIVFAEKRYRVKFNRKDIV